MSLAYTIFPEQRLILERFKGRVTAQEMRQFIEEVWADEAYDKSYNALVDLTEAQLDMKRTDIAAISAFLFMSPDASEGRVAIIASQPIEMALSFLFQSNIAMKNDVAVFSTWESVRDFLRLPDTMTKHLTDKP
jgi:hypothetical protein